MRVWLILLALMALACASTSHLEYRVSRRRGHSSRKLHQRSARYVHQRGPRQEQTTEGAAAAVHNTGEHNKEKAALARYVVHNSKVTPIGTKTSLGGFTDYVGTKDEFVSDTIDGKSTGVPYTYLSKNDPSLRDLNKNNHATMFFTRLLIDNYCLQLPLSSKDPDCARAELVGKMVQVNDTKEKEAALKSFVDIDPDLKDVKQEDYVVRRMDIVAVFVIDHKGGLEPVDIDLYKRAKPEDYALANVTTESAPAKRIV